MAETDLIKLYSQRILALASDMPHVTPIAMPQASVKKRSPQCGSSVTVSVNLENGRVSEFSQDVKACALGQCAASILGQNVIGASPADLTLLRDQVSAMLKQNGPVPSAPFDTFEVLIPARDFKNRHASILLALDATVEACADARAQAS